MKKRFIVLLAFIILMLAVIPSSMAACTSHQWSVISNTNGTCTAGGKTVQRCIICGMMRTTTSTAPGHNWAPATCTSPKKCTRCGMTSGSPLGHCYTEATCTTKKRCIRCGTSIGSSPGHLWSAWTVTQYPSGSADGTQKRTCKRCGAQQTRPFR